MASIQHNRRRGVLNETTMTIHKHETGAADSRAVCGHTLHVEQERLRVVGVQRATEELDARKCGQCFEDGRGY